MPGDERRCHSIPHLYVRRPRLPTELYFFFPLPFAPFPLGALEADETTLPALEVAADVALLPAVDFTFSSCLFCATDSRQMELVINRYGWERDRP